MHHVASSARRFFLSFLCGSFVLAGAGCRDAPTSATETVPPTVDPFEPARVDTGVDLEGFTCENLEEARVRFSDPGYIRNNEVGVYAAFLGAPPGDKFLRIFWDYGNRPNEHQIVDTQEGEVRRDNDELFDIEEVVEHRYEGITRSSDRTVRVELVHEEGRTPLCARNRTISVSPPPAGPSVSCEAATEVLFAGKCYYLDGSGGTCEPGYELAPQSVLNSIAGQFAGKNYKNAVSSNCCIYNSEPDEDWGMVASCNAPGPFQPGEPALGGSGCTDATNLTANQLTLCVTD